jgi:hypothetical protein
MEDEIKHGSQGNQNIDTWKPKSIKEEFFQKIINKPGQIDWPF